MTETILEPVVPANSPASVAGAQSASEMRLKGKRTGMVVFSQYPADPRPRRTIEALAREGMEIDLICEADENVPQREKKGLLDVTRIPIKHFRGGFVSYAYQYSTFLFISAWILAWRRLSRRYDLIYVHNMPDFLVFCALVPRLLGARVILDQHDPMPELMQTIFSKGEDSLPVRILKVLEKISLAFATKVITVNIACQRIFSHRSCKAEKVGVVMNAPDESIFPYRPADTYPVRNSKSPFVIMYHGSLVERNGLGLAIDALALLKETVPNAELRVFGKKTPYLEEVMAKGSQMGLNEKIRYMGPRSLEKLVGEIENCDLGVIPNPLNTFTEINTPTRIFEYLALGKPVVAPTTSGIRDYFAPGTLFFFEPGNAKDLAEKICEVADDGVNAIRVAAKGQTVYQAHCWQQERETLVGLVLAALA